MQLYTVRGKVRLQGMQKDQASTGYILENGQIVDLWGFDKGENRDKV